MKWATLLSCMTLDEMDDSSGEETYFRFTIDNRYVIQVLADGLDNAYHTVDRIELVWYGGTEFEILFELEGLDNAFNLKVDSDLGAFDVPVRAFKEVGVDLS